MVHGRCLSAMREFKRRYQLLHGVFCAVLIITRQHVVFKFSTLFGILFIDENQREALHYIQVDST